MGDSRFACCLQGGGVYVSSGTVTITSSTISGNTANYVRAHAQNFPSPDGKNADALALILACITVTDASMNYSKYVPERPRKFPSPRWEFLLTCPIDSHLSIRIDIWFYQGYVRAQTSHRPDGKIADGLASILACTFAADPPVNYRGYVLQRPETAPSPKSSHRPDGKVADVLGPTHACTTANASVNYRGCVPQRPCKVPIAPMGFHMFCACACRAAVSLFGVAR